MSSQSPYTKEDLIAEIERVEEIVGETPTKTDMLQHGNVSTGPYDTHFGSWSNAISVLNGDLDIEEVGKGDQTDDSENADAERNDSVKNIEVKDMSGYSHVYLVRSENGLVKIGWSKSPEERIPKLQNSSPCQLHLITAMLVPDGREEEQKLHERYAEYNTHGEWFDLPNGEIDKIIFSLANIEMMSSFKTD